MADWLIGEALVTQTTLLITGNVVLNFNYLKSMPISENLFLTEQSLDS